MIRINKLVKLILDNSEITMLIICIIGTISGLLSAFIYENRISMLSPMLLFLWYYWIKAESIHEKITKNMKKKSLFNKARLQI